VNQLPQHIAIIMDGNGRWAQQRDKPRSAGHQAGVNIRLQFIGDLSKFSSGLLKEIQVATEKTAGNSGMFLNIAVNYGGRGELVNAMADIAAKLHTGELNPADITEETITAHTWLAGCPEPDLFVRTGGEQRLSNYLLWHLAYTELAFTDTLWPDFSTVDAVVYNNAISTCIHRGNTLA